MDARTQDLTPAADIDGGAAPERSGLARFAPPSVRPALTFIHRWVG